MTLEIAGVLAIAAVAMVLFVTERLRMDIVAMLVLVALAVPGLVTPAEALSGFSNQATVTVAAMFILAAGLDNTGALSGIGALLGKSKSPTLFLLTLFALLALIAPFVNNTAVVAVFMPIVIAASLRIGLSPTKTLIPLSYVSQMVGVTTLIGTSTNLIVNSVAQDLGHRGFSMFEFLPLGLICLGAGCLYLLTLGRWLLPSQGNSQLDAIHESGYYVTELRVTADARIVGQSVEEARLAADYKVFVLELWRGEDKLWSPRSELLQDGDVLLVRGKWSALQLLQQEQNLVFAGQEGQASPGPAAESDPGPNGAAEEEPPRGRRVMAEVMIAPTSIVRGHRLQALRRRVSDQIGILGIQRRGQVIRKQLDDTVLIVGDILLLVLPESGMADLRRNPNFIVLSEREAPSLAQWRAPFALGVMAAVVALAALGWVPIAVSAIMGVVAMVLARCVDIDDMYEAVDWRILFLMAGLLPLGTAMSSSGAAQFIVDHTVSWVSDLGPHVVLAVLYLMALLLGEMMSNSAAAVLLTPIGLSTAALMQTDATPFLVAITFSASTSFLTPVGYQTNTMVYAAGGYSFSDFLKVGAPLNLIFWVLGVIFIPVFWPFGAV